MTSPLDDLAKAGELQAEPPAKAASVGLVHSGIVRLRDARMLTLSLERQSGLAYNAAHALSLAARHHKGYRSDNRYLVFQTLPHTLQLPAERWRVLDKAHRQRSSSEYDGVLDLDTAMVEALIRVASEVETRVKALAPLP